jgi:6-phosphogluconate dehydrogenase
VTAGADRRQPVNQMQWPRTVLRILSAGEISEMAVAPAWSYLPRRGDANVDGGNAFCKDQLG